jgi:16S rRNA (guanine966-N2)-methyltransferase
VDPPYAETALAEEVLEAAGALLAEDGQIVYEHASRYNPPERPGELVCTDRRTYGDTGIARYTRAAKES